MTEEVQETNSNEEVEFFMNTLKASSTHVEAMIERLREDPLTNSSALGLLLPIALLVDFASSSTGVPIDELVEDAKDLSKTISEIRQEAGLEHKAVH